MIAGELGLGTSFFKEIFSHLSGTNENLDDFHVFFVIGEIISGCIDSCCDGAIT
jgi:hypothetical protein